MKIGFIGVGNIGRSIAGQLLAAGIFLRLQEERAKVEMRLPPE